MQSSLIISGHRITKASPRLGREDHDLWTVTHVNQKWWHGTLTDWTEHHDYHPLTTTPRFDALPVRKAPTWKWLTKQDGTKPIYLQDPQYASDPILARERFAQVPGAVALPLEAIREFHKLRSGELESLFYCQVGLMLAFASMRGYTRIVFNGIGDIKTVQQEYNHRCVYYWMGKVRGMGIDLVVEGPSCYRQPLEVYAHEQVTFPDLAAQRQARGQEQWWRA